TESQFDALLSSFQRFKDLKQPLFGRYPALKKEGGAQTGKHLAMGFYPAFGFGYGRSFAFRQAATQGSIFKLVTGCEALGQKYKEMNGKIKQLSDLNPCVIT